MQNLFPISLNLDQCHHVFFTFFFYLFTYFLFSSPDEKVVEVHTPNELEFALSKGATIFLINMWDRMTGKLFPDQAKGMASLMPVNAVAIAAGDIRTVEQAAELGFYGFDCVVLGRNIADIPDIKDFIDGVHSFRGSPRGMGMGMKGLPWSQ